MLKLLNRINCFGVWDKDASCKQFIELINTNYSLDELFEIVRQAKWANIRGEIFLCGPCFDKFILANNYRRR